jgi:hypothetical protein
MDIYFGAYLGRGVFFVVQKQLNAYSCKKRSNIIGRKSKKRCPIKRSHMDGKKKPAKASS